MNEGVIQGKGLLRFRAMPHLPAVMALLGRKPTNCTLHPQDDDHAEYRDGLTGLLNRKGLAREISLKNQRGERFALLFLDLDRFAEVNERFGHKGGDALLKSVADRLCAVSGSEDKIARIAGDEFAILAATPDPEAAKLAGEHYAAAVSEAGFIVAHRVVAASASVGVAFCSDGRELGPLLGEADAALYEAKCVRQAPLDRLICKAA